MSKTTNLLEAHGARFLDPANVGSSVRWKVTVEQYPKGHVRMEGELSLSDCSRIITWSAYDNDQLLVKVQGAIAELKTMEKALKKAAALKAKFPDPDDE